MLYEIINFSDSYTFEADDHEIAALAMILVSEGRYGCREVDDRGQEGKFTLPPLIFSGARAIDTYFKAQFGRTLDESIELLKASRLEELAKCYESVVLGSAKDRLLFKSALDKIDDPAKKQAFLKEWDDKKRSSLNNIGAACQQMALTTRELIAKKASA
jgi:hypothetical protein